MWNNPNKIFNQRVSRLTSKQKELQKMIQLQRAEQLKKLMNQQFPAKSNSK